MPDTHATQLEPWQWSEEHWRGLVKQVRAGQPYRPKSWKDGARCAVALSFDSDHETNELRDGGQSIGRLCWGEYGARVGVPRIRKLLDKHGVKATFYVPAVSALLHPEEQRALMRFIFSSTEFGRPYVLPPGVPQERVEVMRKALAMALEDPALVGDAARMKMDMTYRSPERIERLVAALYETPPALIETVKKLVPNLD